MPYALVPSQITDGLHSVTVINALFGLRADGSGWERRGPSARRIVLGLEHSHTTLDFVDAIFDMPECPRYTRERVGSRVGEFRKPEVHHGIALVTSVCEKSSPLNNSGSLLALARA